MWSHLFIAEVVIKLMKEDRKKSQLNLRVDHCMTWCVFNCPLSLITLPLCGLFEVHFIPS